MAKKQEWSTNIDNISYQITFVLNQWSGKHQLIVNGNEIAIQRKPFQVFTGIDQPLKLGSKEARFVLIGNKADMAIDGTYLGSGKTYMPLKNVPWWTWVFVIVCAAIPIVALGGAVPFVLAIAGAIFILRVAIMPDLKTGIKLLACLGISLADWILFFALLLLISSIK